MSTHPEHGRDGEHGYEVDIDWEGIPVRAWCPAPLLGREPAVGLAAGHACETAAAEAVRLDQQVQELPDAAALLFLRTEAIGSSHIEDIRAPVDQMLFTTLAETAPGAATAAAQLSAANASALDLVMSDSAGEKPLTVETLNAWHRELLRSDPRMGEQFLGRLRPVQVWIDGTTPLLATHVFPPPELVPEMLEDLCGFVNGSQGNAVVLGGLAHAQFECIHPYADGNGRVGRMLVEWILARRLALSAPPPVSSAIALDRSRYYSALRQFEDGHVDEWLQWFADRVVVSVGTADKIAHDLQSVLTGWREAVGKRRAGSAVAGLPDLLARRPIVSIGRVADELGVSSVNARRAILEFEALGILESYQPDPRPADRTRRWWVAPAAVELLQDLVRQYG